MTAINSLSKSGLEGDFSKQEQYCEFLYTQSGPFYHLCTGNESPLIFSSEEHYIYATNSIAICVADSPIQILTYALMSNHVHFVLQGSKDECESFFERFKKRVKHYFSIKQSVIDFTYFECKLYPIDSLSMLRNELVYTNRNGYVVQSHRTPFSYPWSSAYLYYNIESQFIVGELYSSLNYRERRLLCRSHAIELPPQYRVSRGMFLPQSFTAYRTGMEFFRNAHSYLSLLLKNVESYANLAKRHADNIFLTDDELYQAVIQLCQKTYNTKFPSTLPPKEKIELARKIHFDYNASNGQICRILKIERKIVAEMFPQVSQGFEPTTK